MFQATRWIAFNALFFVGGIVITRTHVLLYQLAIAGVLLALHHLWMLSVVRRARREGARRVLNASEYTLDCILTDWDEIGAHLSRP